MKNYVTALLLVAIATVATATPKPKPTQVPITFKATFQPFIGECGADGLCYVGVYNGTMNTLYIACLPAQEAVLMDGHLHTVTVGLLGTVIETTPITNLYIVGVR